MTTILITEDQETITQLEQTILKDTPFDVTFCENNQIGWEIYLKNKFDLIIIDFQTPIINGDVLQGRIRAKNKQVPILFFSGNHVDLNDLEDSTNTEFLLKTQKNIFQLPYIIPKLLARYNNGTY